MINLLDLDAAGMEALVADLGEKPFRAKQLSHWVHQRLADDVAAMTDLSRAFREKLASVAEIRGPTVVRDTTASDGTRKWLLDVGAGNAVEMVYIPEDDRGTLCVSSQAGCALDCAFCSTGKQGFNRNLTTGEIVGQLWHANRALLADGIASPPDRSKGQLGRPKGELGRPKGELGRPKGEGRPLEGCGGRSTSPWVEQGRAPVSATGRPERELLPLGGTARSAKGAPITNVVMMGMGEPLANYDNVVAALRLMLDDNAYGLSRRRVTLSTSGLVPALDRLREDCPVALAVSLHAGNDPLRDRLVPINRKYPLAELLAASVRYLERAPRDFVTFEYVMLDGVNDSVEQAKELALLVRDVPCKFNLIPWNPFPGAEFATSHRSRILAFQKTLTEAGLVTTIRKTRGDDIDAACGQLAGRVQDRTKRQIRIQRAATRTAANAAPH